MVELGKLYTYSEYIKVCKILKHMYAGKLKVSTIGKTWENRDIVLFQIGSGANALTFTAGVHGRESINVMVLLKIIEDCCRYDEKYWKENTLYVIPLLNPDGYVIANMKGYRMWKGNGRGVDINRNFPSATWKKKFTGDKALSEPETKALVYFFEKHMTDMYIDFHSRGKEIYYNRAVMNTEYNIRQRKIAEKLSELTGYSLVDAKREIETEAGGGNTVHYFSERYEKPAITIETVDNDVDFPMDAMYQRETYEEIRQIVFEMLYLIKEEYYQK